MYVTAPKQSSFKPVPPGSHLARCYRIIDFGTQKTEFAGQIKFLHKGMFQFEVYGEDEDGNPLVTEKGEPMSISKNYTMSLGEKTALTADLESWRGKAFTGDERNRFNLKNVIGQWCLITVTKTEGRDGKEYSNIVSISPVPAAMKASKPEPKTEARIFDLSDPDMSLYETFSDRIKEKIQLSPEWKALNGKKTEDFNDETIPF